MRLRCLAAVVAVAVAAGGAPAEDVPNPAFVSWARFKPGTSVTFKTTARLGDLSKESTITLTLIEVGADKLVTEVAFAGKWYGIEGTAAPVRTDVPKARAGTGEDDADERPAGTFDEGTETLTISDKPIKTKWYRFKSETGGVKTEGTARVSRDTPVPLVKQTITTTSGAYRTTETLEVTELKKP